MSIGNFQIAEHIVLLDKSNMAVTLKEKISNRLQELDRNPFEAARLGKLERSFINDILIEKKVSVQHRSLPKLAQALDWTVGELTSELEGISGDMTTRLPKVQLVGYVGAGATMFFADADSPEEFVDAPFGSNSETVAVEIRGESLGSMFDRWLVFYDQVRVPPAPGLLGKLCVVGLADGRILVKQLKKGQLEGHFNLISNTEPPIYDAIVEWAAVVKQMTPR